MSSLFKYDLMLCVLLCTHMLFVLPGNSTESEIPLSEYVVAMVIVDVSQLELYTC